MFQGPKGYIAQICKVRLQYGNKKAVLHVFLVNSPLIYILFSLCITLDNKPTVPLNEKCLTSFKTLSLRFVRLTLKDSVKMFLSGLVCCCPEQTF